MDTARDLLLLRLLRHRKSQPLTHSWTRVEINISLTSLLPGPAIRYTPACVKKLFRAVPAGAPQPLLPLASVRYYRALRSYFLSFTLFSNEYLDGHSKMQPDLIRTHISPAPHPIHTFYLLRWLCLAPPYLCVHQANKSIKYIVMLSLSESAKFICTDQQHSIYCSLRRASVLLCVFRFQLPPGPEYFPLRLFRAMHVDPLVKNTLCYRAVGG